MIFKGYSRWRLWRRRPSMPCLFVVFITTTFSVTILLIVFELNRDNSDGLQFSSTRPRKIIVSSYMRSGSTLTADIIQQDPGVFYVFEPLFSLEKIIKSYLAPLYLHKPFKMIRTEYNSKINTLVSFLTCDLPNVDLTTLHQHHMDRSLSTLEYNLCIHNSSLGEFETECLQPLTRSCLSSKNVLVKTIRSKMEYMEELLHLNKDLKVILLIRDPRAVLFSRARLYLGGAKGREALDHHIRQAPSLCSSIHRDLQDAHRLSRLYPRQVAILLYEKLVQNPQAISKIMYDFLDLGFTPKIAAYVHNITNAGLPDNCPVCTTRKNATETANRWRIGLGYDDVLSIDKSCLGLYHQLGYRSFRSDAELYNLRNPAWEERAVPSMLTDRNDYATKRSAIYR